MMNKKLSFYFSLNLKINIKKYYNNNRRDFNHNKMIFHLNFKEKSLGRIINFHLS